MDGAAVLTTGVALWATDMVHDAVRIPPAATPDPVPPDTHPAWVLLTEWVTAGPGAPETGAPETGTSLADAPAAEPDGACCPSARSGPSGPTGPTGQAGRW